MSSLALLGAGGGSGVVTYAGAVLADSPYGYWKDWSAATVQDETAGNHDIALVGATTGVAGPGADPADNCAQFDGVNDSGSVALDLSDTNVLTVELWSWWDAFGAGDNLLTEFTTNANNFTGGFYIDPNSSTFGGRYETRIVGNVGGNVGHVARPSAAAWHHYAFVLDKTAVVNEVTKVYVDGASVAITNADASNNTNNFANDTLYLMSRAGSSLFAAGRVAHLAVYKAELSAARVAAHYAAGT